MKTLASNIGDLEIAELESRHRRFLSQMDFHDTLARHGVLGREVQEVLPECIAKFASEGPERPPDIEFTGYAVGARLTDGRTILFDRAYPYAWSEVWVPGMSPRDPLPNRVIFSCELPPPEVVVVPAT